MKRNLFIVMMTAILSAMGTHHAFAYDIAVENEGKTIYYKYSSDGTELIVTYLSDDSYYYYNNNAYQGNVVIPEEVTYMNRTRKVTSIGDHAFYGCTGLTSITIPNSVTSIGDHAFWGCTGLTSITIPNSVTSIGGHAFKNCTGLTSINIPNSVTSIGYYAFESCSGLTSVTISNSITSISYSAFSGCTGLTSVTIPNSVTSIDYYAFSGCTGLTSVTIGNSVTSIGYSAFRNCTSLTSVTIGNSVTSISESAFEGCSGLTTLTIPNSVTSIGDHAFYGCTGLTSITIPNSVTSIGDHAFWGCTGLMEVVSLIEEPFAIYGKNSDGSTFTLDVFNNVTLYVPVGTKEKYKNTDGWKDFLFIEEGTGSGGGTTPEPEQCAKPTISYANGKLMFSCATDGATCQYTITDRDIKSGIGDEVELCVTYQVSVYATKAGYNNSETATATLCWIDVEPTITFGTGATALGSIEAVPVLIQTNGPVVSITGAAEGTEIDIYDVSGKLVGSAKASVGTTDICTTLRDKDIAIVKIGSKSVKVVMK